MDDIQIKIKRSEMSNMNTIRSRRSIRQFKNTPIPQGDIEKLINAGIQAPSAKNRQPWRFVVVENDSKAKMIETMEKGLARESLSPQLPESHRYSPFLN